MGRQRRRGSRNPRQRSYRAPAGKRGSEGEEAGGRLIPLWPHSRWREELELDPLQPCLLYTSDAADERK